jgi:hypothetical protein
VAGDGNQKATSVETKIIPKLLLVASGFKDLPFRVLPEK